MLKYFNTCYFCSLLKHWHQALKHLYMVPHASEKIRLLIIFSYKCQPAIFRLIMEYFPHIGILPNRMCFLELKFYIYKTQIYFSAFPLQGILLDSENFMKINIKENRFYFFLICPFYVNTLSSERNSIFDPS